MRAVAGVLGLLMVLAVVGFLAKKQLSPTAGSSTRGSEAAVGTVNVSPALPKQVGASVDAVMQQPRPMPEDK